MLATTGRFPPIMLLLSLILVALAARLLIAQKPSLRPLEASASRLDVEVGEAIALGGWKWYPSNESDARARDSSGMRAVLQFDPPVAENEEIELQNSAAPTVPRSTPVRSS